MKRKKKKEEIIKFENCIYVCMYINIYNFKLRMNKL
jgi:hypothetical protein